ncbi:MAG: dTDP-4-dehydrorhamnose 3,5-epimerase, partial [Actinobacteria bacterium]
RSDRGVVRGLHYQIQRPQGKLVRVVRGAAFDAAVDIRRGSPTFGSWVGTELSEANKLQMWIPAGFAHGFMALVDGTELLYKATDFYDPETDRSIAWNDPALAIDWPTAGIEPIVSGRDLIAPPLSEAETYE